MSVALRLVLDGEVDVHSFISWFCNRISKENTPSPLTVHDHLRDAFASYFLGYLREQTAEALGLHNSGLTPRKAIAKTDSLTAPIAAATARIEPASRTRLRFQPRDSSDVSVFRDRSINGISAAVPSTSNSNQTPIRQGSAPHRWSTGLELKSKQKMSLGQFINDSSGNQGTKSSPVTQANRGNRHGKPSSKNRSLRNSTDALGGSGGGSIDLNDMVAFPDVTVTAATKRIATRRITPTPVAEKSFRLPGSLPGDLPPECLQADSSNVFTDATAEPSPRNLQHERSLLKKARDQREPLTDVTPVDRFNCSTSATPAPPGYVYNTSSAFPSTDATSADVLRTRVTFEQQLSCLARIYSACIDENLLQCLSVELHFSVQLLTAQELLTNMPDLEKENDMPYLSSVANCVYFAVHVLWLQRATISFLDATTLKALRDNQRVKEFSPKLHQFLSDKCVGAKALSVSAREGGGGIPNTIVTFQTDTDDRNNFVTDNAFHVFRKKRDVFYEILRDWQEHHSTPNWSVAAKLGERIRLLVTTDCDAFLFTHLARLFQAQLVLTCRGHSSAEQHSEDDPKLLEMLRECNPEKYERLRERLVTPNQSTGPCPSPNFPGQQEFFKSFLDHAGSPGFSQHLANVIGARICELNATQLELREEDGEAEADARTRDQFRQCLLTLRLLAKFLGYIVFAPYRAGDSVPERILAAQVAVRDTMMPSVDALRFLREAIRSGRTVLVVSWLVEFCAMMDPVAPFLSYYRAVLNQLHDLHGKFKSKSVSSLDGLLLRLLLGWLFEIVNLPPPSEFQEPSGPAFAEPQSPRALDRLNVVDLETLYACCPHLSELPALLSRFAGGVSNQSNQLRRKITPVSTGRKPADTASTARQLQQQMVDSFFHSQPDSLRKTVDFTVERLSSKVIKHVRRHLMAEARQWGVDEVGQLRLSLDAEAHTEVYQKAKIAAYKRVCDAAVVVAEKIKWETNEYCKRVCFEEAGKILPLLLPDETSPDVLKMCVKFVRRSCSIEVRQWLSTQVDADHFRKDLVHEMQKLLKLSPSSKFLVEDAVKTVDAPFVPPAIHDSDAPSPVDALFAAKRLLKDLYVADRPIAADDVFAVLSSVSCSLKNRKDLTAPAFKTMIRMTAEIAMAIVIKTPHLFNRDILLEFVTLWGVYPAEWTSIVLPSIFSVRSFKYMGAVSEDVELSLANVAMLTLAFLNSHTDAAPSIDELCLKLFQCSWEEEFQGGVIRCFGSVLARSNAATTDGGSPVLPLLSEHLNSIACQEF